MPTEASYVRALQALDEAGLAPSWRELLRAHWAAPAHTTSMALLAATVGYPNHSAANLNYGRLAARIGQVAGVPPGATRVRLWAVATWGESEPSAAGHFTFSMRPQLARALESLGWTRGARPPRESLDPTSGMEGEQRLLLTAHVRREGRLRQQKLREAIQRSPDGRLRCEVPGCGFDFALVYGSVGLGFAEVHHLQPLSARSRPGVTQLSDLAVVCANCHAMVHRGGACRPLDGLIVQRRTRRGIGQPDWKRGRSR